MKYLILTILLFTYSVKITSSQRCSTISEAQYDRVMKEYESKLVLEKQLRQLDLFLDKMGFLESTNNPDTVNVFGFIGKYQFGKSALKEVGYGHISVTEFKNNKSIFTEEMQRDAMIKFMKLNKRRMHKLIKRYDGKNVNGIFITESGMIAAAHLAGTGNVAKFLNSGEDFGDAFNTKVSKYLKEFSQYNLSLI